MLLLYGQVVEWCRERGVGLVLIGPEAPLVDGLADSLRAAGQRVFGPSAAAAQLEGSKQFLKVHQPPGAVACLWHWGSSHPKTLI